MMLKLCFAISISVFLLSCSSTRFVEPLKKSQNAVGVDLGGPIVRIPGVAIIPIPFTSITYGRGLTNNTTAFGSFYPTASIFSVFQFDMGIVQNVWYSQEKKMGVSISPQANFAVDSFEKNFKFWPILEANYYWKYKIRFQQQDDLLNGSKIRYNYFYGGVNSWFELDGTKAHGEKQTTRVIPNVQVGHSFRRNSWSFNLEMKLIAPFSNNQNIVLDYKSITGSNGATGIYFGIVKRF